MATPIAAVFRHLFLKTQAVIIHLFLHSATTTAAFTACLTREWRN
jgi:hypothetical protein